MSTGKLCEPQPSPASSRVFNIVAHGVGDPQPWVTPAEREVWVSTELLHAVLDRVATASDLRLSFDDGNRSDFDTALPALLERGLTATFFIVVDRIGREGFLAAGDLQTLVANGMSLGSHGYRHRAWRNLADHELDEELVRSREVLEDVAGIEINAAAVPFGAYDRRALRALREAGYETVFTSDGGSASPGAWLQPRNSLRAWDGSQVVDDLRGASRLQEVARRSKRLAKAWR